MRRDLGGEVEFLDPDVVRQPRRDQDLHGEDYTVSHVPLEARAVLNSFDERAAHYEVIDRREQ